MTMDDFVHAVNEQQLETNSRPTMQDSLISLRIAKTYSILRHNRTDLSPSGEPKIYLNDFCFFHLLMARPDPEVDIAFLLMDEKQTGQIFLTDLAKFLRPAFPYLYFRSQFFQRYFGKNGTQSIRQTHFSQFLVDLQREMGKQAFLCAVARSGTPEGYIAPDDFVRILKTACGWSLPQSVADRLESIYCCDRSIDKGDRRAVSGPDLHGTGWQRPIPHRDRVSIGRAGPRYPSRIAIWTTQNISVSNSREDQVVFPPP